MIFSQIIPGRTFSICYGNMSPNQHANHPNNHSSNLYNQLLYVFNGGGNIVQAGEILTVTKDNIYDLSKFKNAPIDYVSGDEGVWWAAINPKFDDFVFYDLIKDENQFDVTTGNNDKYIICLTGNILCNGKTILPYNYVRVTRTKLISLQTAKDSRTLILTC